MKKILISFLCGVAFALPLVAVAAIPFTDVKPTDWFYTAVDHLYSWGVVQDSGNHKFRPDHNITRAETAVAIDRYNDYAKTQFALKGETSDGTRNLSILDHSLTKESDKWTLHATIKNNSQKTVNYPQIIAIFYDKNNKQLLIHGDFSDPLQLLPQAEGIVLTNINPIPNFDHYTIDIYK